MQKNTISNSRKVPSAKFRGNDRLSFFINIWQFGSFKNPIATITSQSELYFRFRRFILLVQAKKVISMNYGSSKSSWKPWRWVRLDLLLTMRVIYINSNLDSLTKFTSSSWSTELKDIFPWSISQMITKTIAISMTIVIMLYNERGLSDLSLMENQWDNNMIRVSSRGKAIVEQTLVSR